MSRCNNSQILTDFPTKILVYFSVSWDSGDLFRVAIEVHGVTAAFAKKFASLLFKVLYELNPFHAVNIPKGSLTISLPVFSFSLICL
jgi:hypothetical protein